MEEKRQFCVTWPLKKCRTLRSSRQPAQHQKEALAKLHAWYEGRTDADPYGGILVLPTGGGKTFTAVHFLCNNPLSDGFKVLWLAHTHHLLEQAFHAFTDEAVGQIREPREELKVRVVSGTPGHYPPRDIEATDDVVIATLQTITNAHQEGLPSLKKFLKAASDKLLVVFDEAHHSPAPSYRHLLEALQADGAAVLGLTATPTHSDQAKRSHLSRLFPQGILYQAKAANLIAQGILARPKFERTPTRFKPDFSEGEYQKWVGTYRDVPDDIINKLAKDRERNALIAETYAKNKQRYGKTIIFTDRWYQCEAIVEALGRRGVKAEAVYSHVDARTASVEGRRQRNADENAKVLQRFREGKFDVLVNVRMLTEGTDIPDAQSVFLTRQTTSQILQTQMVGRALRGPKFGGTADANIVAFTDEWDHAIRWAEFDPLVDEGKTDKAGKRRRRLPLHLISIDLIKRLARQMDAGANVTPGPFLSLMPVGWYLVSYDSSPSGSDEVELREELVMVFEDERKGFEKLIAELTKTVDPSFERESVQLQEQRDALDVLQQRHFPKAARTAGDLRFEIFHIARHVAQGRGVPEFFPFEERDKHDVDALASEFVSKDLGPRAIHERLRDEYEKPDRFWRALFPRFEQLRSYYDGCQARLLAEQEGERLEVRPEPAEPPTFLEPDDKVKAQVRQRDGDRCLACGRTTNLQVDHVSAAYSGGPKDIGNLQTLCARCNRQKDTQRIRFTTQQTARSAPLPGLVEFNPPADPADREGWESFLRATTNFFYQCGAVAEVAIGGRGHGYYNWRVELFAGNDPRWLKPHLRGLVERIDAARAKEQKPALESLTVVAPGVAEVTWPAKRR